MKLPTYDKDTLRRAGEILRTTGLRWDICCRMAAKERET